MCKKEWLGKYSNSWANVFVFACVYATAFLPNKKEFAALIWNPFWGVSTQKKKIYSELQSSSVRIDFLTY